MPNVLVAARAAVPARRGLVASLLLLCAAPVAADTVVATVPIGQSPYGVAVLPNGTRAYTANYTSDNVSVIDTATNTVATTIAAGSHPYGIAAHPDGTRVYV